MVISLERGADLHTAKLMPLPLTVSCFSKIQTGFTFLVPAHPGRPGQRAVKRVCVCGTYNIYCFNLTVDEVNLPSVAVTSPELTTAGSHERSGTERDDQSNSNHIQLSSAS